MVVVVEAQVGDDRGITGDGGGDDAGDEGWWLRWWNPQPPWAILDVLAKSSSSII